MAFMILPGLSLILYIIGFISPSLVVYMAVAGFILSIVSYNIFKNSTTENMISTIGKNVSLALIVVGVVYLVVIFLSRFILGPILSSII